MKYEETIEKMETLHIKNPYAIKSIIVEKLFGYYNYHLEKDTDNDGLGKLLLFYGDNGSGKTTVLKLLFYLLSTKNNSEFKTRIAQIKFKNFSVTFENDIEISAVRKGSELIGSFYFTIKEKGNIKHQIFLTAKEDFSIQVKDNLEDENNYLKALKYINDLNISVFFLTDNRKIFDSQNSVESEFEKYLTGNHFSINELQKIQYLKDKPETISLDIRPAIDNLTDWIKQQLILNSKVGEENSNTLYTLIIKSLTSKRVNFTSETKDIPDKNEFINRLKNLSDQTNEYSVFGLISPFKYDEIIQLISETDIEVAVLIYKILDPFIQGLQARLNALEHLKNTIKVFISSVNSYFSEKEVTFHISKGFTIRHSENEPPIDFETLSSGERQFLLLLCNTITVSDKATIFIIDEPEISLNVKWQRKLLNTLLNFTKDKFVQFIIATHSIEIINSHKNNLIKFQNTK